MTARFYQNQDDVRNPAAYPSKVPVSINYDSCEEHMRYVPADVLKLLGHLQEPEIEVQGCYNLC